MFSATASGVYRSGAYFAPFYTRDYFAELLENYAVKIGAYNAHYQELEDSINDREAFLGFVEEMLTIYLEMDVWEASRSFAGSYTALERANSTFWQMYHYFNVSREDLEEAEEEFIEGIEQALEDLWKEAMRNFVKGITEMVFGRPRGFNARQIEEDLKRIMDGIESLAEAMELLAECMEYTERMMAWIEDVMSRSGFDRTLSSKQS